MSFSPEQTFALEQFSKGYNLFLTGGGGTGKSKWIKHVYTHAIEKELNIPIDSKATIVSLDLLGTKAVNIEMGVSNTMLKDNEMITGTIELGTIESLGASATPVMENAKITLASLETTVQILGIGFGGGAIFSGVIVQHIDKINLPSLPKNPFLASLVLSIIATIVCTLLAMLGIWIKKLKL
jgi:hypothetical protein